VQARLGLNADGDFGPGTEQALKNWQAANGLTADGIAGPATLARLLG
jgi:peptidoglycan hydrolase-like protein with peptidoglycan-binding domain